MGMARSEKINSEDSNDLASFGYSQELDRSLGSFSSFAAGFSYISIMTGLFQMFYLGYGAGGHTFVWSWPTVFLGQFLVALGFAELAAHYPLSGGVYQWSKMIGSSNLGWLVGWIYTSCLIVTLAAVALALQTSLPQISPVFQLIGSASNAQDSAINAVILGCGLILITTLLNSVGVAVMAFVNNAGVFSELIGVVILIFCLAFKTERGVGDVLFSEGMTHGTQGFWNPFLTSAALTASYVLYGFDTAGSLAEETSNPRKRAPRAILQALLAASTMGLLVLLFALMAVKNLNAPELGQMDGGLPWIVKSVLGEKIGTFFLYDVIFAICVCALAVHTGAIRLIHAMARDGGLPNSKSLAKVSQQSKAPILPAVIVGAIAIFILVVNIHMPKIVELVTMMAVLWANLAYLLVTGALLLRRFRGWPKKSPGLFTLGRWGLPVNVIGFFWSLFMVLNVGWPRESVYGAEWQYRFAPIELTLILLISGLILRKVLGLKLEFDRKNLNQQEESYPMGAVG